MPYRSLRNYQKREFFEPVKNIPSVSSGKQVPSASPSIRKPYRRGPGTSIFLRSVSRSKNRDIFRRSRIFHASPPRFKTLGGVLLFCFEAALEASSDGEIRKTLINGLLRITRQRRGEQNTCTHARTHEWTQ